MAEGTRDPEVRSFIGNLLANARKEIAEAFGQDIPPVGSAGTEGDARTTLAVALLDGLLLHRLMDPSFSLDGIAPLLKGLLAKGSAEGLAE